MGCSFLWVIGVQSQYQDGLSMHRDLWNISPNIKHLFQEKCVWNSYKIRAVLPKHWHYLFLLQRMAALLTNSDRFKFPTTTGTSATLFPPTVVISTPMSSVPATKMVARTLVRETVAALWSRWSTANGRKLVGLGHLGPFLPIGQGQTGSLLPKGQGHIGPLLSIGQGQQGPLYIVTCH